MREANKTPKKTHICTTWHGATSILQDTVWVCVVSALPLSGEHQMTKTTFQVRERARERGGRTRVFMQIEWESPWLYFKQTLVLWTYNMNYMLRKCICRLVNCSLCFCFVLIGVRNQCYSNVEELFSHPSWNRHPFESLWINLILHALIWVQIKIALWKKSSS